MRVDFQVEVDSTGAMFVMAGGRCYFVGGQCVKDFLGGVMCDVVSE